MPKLLPSLVAAVLLSPVLGWAAQGNGAPTVFFKTNVGSFKLLGNENQPANGKIQVSFTGTILVNAVSTSDPKITVTGNIRKEYEKNDDSKQRHQIAYHGTGSMTIDGQFISIQWFGRDMSAQWTGFGIARLVGEFDKDLKTGTYWYSVNPDDKRDWGTQLKEITEPPRPEDVVPIPRGRKGG